MKTKQKYQIDNINLFPGFYESELFNSDSEYDWNRNNECDENFVECEIKDFKGFTEYVSKEIAYVISGYLCSCDDICDKCDFHEISSPRQYNYSTDKLILDINIDLDLLKEWCLNTKEIKDGFDKYLKRHYTSCSGFCSFVENDVDEFFEKSYEKYYDVLIDYYILTNVFESFDIDLYEIEGTMYFDRICEIANYAMYEFMLPIE